MKMNRRRADSDAVADAIRTTRTILNKLYSLGWSNTRPVLARLERAELAVSRHFGHPSADDLIATLRAGRDALRFFENRGWVDHEGAFGKIDRAERSLAAEQPQS